MTKLKPTPFDSILIANRGEIACRVMRTAKSMGLRTIAVYSDADANARHVKMADQAVLIGPAPVGESYLVIDKILDAAKQTGAQAIHPGYGFLSENADFAKACTKAGLVFIGPKPDAIDLMGDKAKSKRRMIKAGVPCVPGYQGEKQDDKTLIAESKNIGFPIMVKAAAGGGGRGMRLVTNTKALPDAIKDARSEATNAFGSDVLILEKAVQKPRHVEIQVFADTYGNTVHLGERDCSVQRRHQKVLEEAPCPVMTDELREAMGAAAVKAAKDINYVGAGTVEFMLDSAGEFYFLEMNTRLQVEHPVTEMIAGLDLVELQIRVARGEKLEMNQNDIALNGHAIEARLYAEDPSVDFLPATGPINLWQPATGEGIRIDAGIETGGEVSPYYDPMIAKVIAHGHTREDARQKLIKALEETSLFGVKTNKSFLIDVLSHDEFAQGNATTAFIGENFNAQALAVNPASPNVAAIAAVLQYEQVRDHAMANSVDVACQLINWSSGSKITTPYTYMLGETKTMLAVTPQCDQAYSVSVGEEILNVEMLKRTAHQALISVEGARKQVFFHTSSNEKISLSMDGVEHTLINQNAIYASAEDAGGAGTIMAPMHGALLDVFVKAGDTVTKGQRLAILEAMKMQHEILADIDGTVSAVNVKAGSQIAADSLMFELISEDNN
ncbi:MAG: acetyl-CoA carboxylase biotin carboxylase subunit [Acidimicrobiales bacterium]|nr:acetyl-CoA carboxylase biotin carboxylase subunit [Hyphomonadaceae bacterium]RZV37416.1 MAG: acetyl-CoA carboxylase biotin carboxylase subunit [Acidimicrobiales bacterium]